MPKMSDKTLVELTTHVAGGPRMLVDHEFAEVQRRLRTAQGGFVNLMITPQGWEGQQNELCINVSHIVMTWPHFEES